MKNLSIKVFTLLSLMLGLFIATDSFGQGVQNGIKGEYRLASFTKSDTSLNVVNSSSESDTFQFGEKQAMSNVIITATIQKVGGTIVNGSAKLYGSTTGAYWEPIVGAGDTMTIAASNPSYSSSKQGYSWEFGPATAKYRRFKVVYTLYGSTAVMRFQTKTEYY